MPELPPDPPPILEYATPERRVPVYLVVILYLWAVVDVVGGAFLSILGFLLIFLVIKTSSLGIMEGLAMLVLLVGFFLFFLGLGLITWGGMTFTLANQMRQNQVVVLCRTARLVIVADIFAWILASVVFVIILSDKVTSKWMPLLFFVGIAVAVSVTRVMLRRAVRRMGRWGQTELQS